MGTWIQPVLTSNGSLGDILSVSSGGGANSDAYKAFDSSATSYLNKMNSGAWLQFVTSDIISINSISIFSDDQYLPQSGILQVSDDGVNWIDVGSWLDSEGASVSAVVTLYPYVASVSGNYFRLLSQSKSALHPSNNADISNVVIDADYASESNVNFNLNLDTRLTAIDSSKIQDGLKIWLQFNNDITFD